MKSEEKLNRLRSYAHELVDELYSYDFTAQLNARDIYGTDTSLGALRAFLKYLLREEAINEKHA